jgi:hypothetical protein
VPSSIFLDFYLPNATTWFYLSALLAVALFYQFHRLLSLRNWDLVTIFMLVPGLLLLQEAAAASTKTDRFWIGYLWLLVGTWYYFARCMLDLALVRRPALHPNLNLPGLAWLTGTLFICLGGVALRPETEPEPQVGRGSTVLDESQKRVVDLVTQTTGLGGQVPALDGRGTKYWVERGFAGACHLGVVVALILIGIWHFQDARAGMAAATLYLLLPYVAFHVTQIHHVWPTALLLWAIVFYRRPIVAGALVGAAVGSLFFPAVTLPVWASFYWKRGARRFLGAVVVTAGVSLILTVLLLWWDGRLGVIWATLSQPDWVPWRQPQPESFWHGLHWAYRIPVFIIYVFFVAATAFWPAPKNLAHLLALLAAVLLGIQFWYGDRGGVYVLWYLPILLLVVFRPNLSDRRPPIPESDDDFVLWAGRAVRRFVQRFTQRPEPVARAVVTAFLLAAPVTFGFSAPVKPSLKESAAARLAGVWELRSDDGRSGRLILNPDGRLAAASTASDRPLPDYEGHWFLLDEAGNRFVLEFGRKKGGLDSYQVTLVLTCPDAFTLVETIKNGVPTWDQHRFVRTAQSVPNPP